jgi:hypothetical protein
LKAQLTILMLDPILCLMKKAVYLTDPAEMRKMRLNQPRVSAEQARRQREALRRASEKFSEDAKSETCSRGPVSRGG